MKLKISILGIAALLAGYLCWLTKPNGDVVAFIQHSATVGWAQLFSALGAILATWMVSRTALDASVEREQAANRDRIERAMRSVILGSAYLRATINEASNHTKAGTWSRAQHLALSADLAGAQAVLAAIPLAELPNSRLVSSGIGFQKLAARANIFLDFIGKAVADKKPLSKDFVQELDDGVAAACRELDEEASKVRAAFKSRVRVHAASL